jgi:L-ascorbate metabolism protein UlaG (beta-lactamase superfamily)
MEITFLGHACFRIKGKYSSIVCDPFTPEMLGYKFPKVEADIVTISHSHADHNNFSAVSGVRRVIEGPGEYEVGGVSILGFRSFHDDKGGSERGKNTIYVYELDDLRICHLGDLGHELSNELLENIGNIDILMIPVGGFFTVGPEQAGNIARNIEASIILPMHYFDPDLKEDIGSKLATVDSFLEISGLSAEKMDKLNIRKEDILDGGQKIVLLNRRI